MIKIFLRISLSLAVSLTCGQSCFAATQNAVATDNSASQSIAESSPSYPDAPSAVESNSSKQSHSRKAEPAIRGGELAAVVADRKYMGMMSTMFASSIVNVEETNKCLQQRTCSFVPDAFRSRSALYAVGIPAEVGVAYLSYKLKQHGHRWWFVPAVAVTAANTYVAYHSSQR